jgi:hypothetical protein
MQGEPLGDEIPHDERCTRDRHEALKRDERKFRRATRFLGVQSPGKESERELRNCRSCGSTLSAPPTPPRRRRR